MNKKSFTKVFLNQRKALRLSGDTHRALKVAPWLISAAAAWFTFAPCGTALAAHEWKSDGSSALNGTLSFENTINPAERNKEGELPASWTKNGGDAKGQVELTGVRGISENIYGALVESGKGNAYESSVSITGRSSVGGTAVGASVESGKGNAYESTVSITGSSVRGAAVGALLYSGIGDAHNNRVNVVDESRVEGSVYGAFMNNKSTGHAYINSIIIKNSSVEGGYVFCAVINGSTGNAYNNEVTVDHATVTNGQQKMGTVTGAVLEKSTGNAHDNTVSIKNNSTVDDASGAFLTRSTGAAYSNKVTIDNSTVDDIIGASMEMSTGDAHDNELTVADKSRMEGMAIGAFIHKNSTGDAYTNSITIQNSSVEGDYVSCATIQDSTGNAYTNTVTIKEKSSATGNVFGADLNWSTGDAYANTVTIKGKSSVEGAVYGAVFDTSTGDAYTNTVVIKENSSVTGQVFGAALRLSTGNAYNNTVTIDHAAESDEQLLMGSVTGAVLAGSTGDAHNNTVKLYSSPVKGAVTGGAVITVYPDGNKDTVIRSTGDAYANTVALDKSVVGGMVVGGLVNHSTGNAYKNAVRISGDSAVNDIVYGGYLFGSLGKADRNDAIVSGGKLAGGVYGGLVEYTAQGAASTETPDATADHNTVTLSGVGVKTNADTSLHVGVENEGIFGGCVRPGEIYPGISASADANAVSLSRVSADGVRVYGGLIASGSAKDSSGSAQSPVRLSASGNNVFLEQSSAGDVYGGIVKVSPASTTGSAQPEATVTAGENTVILAGESSVSGSVYGGSVSRINASTGASEGAQAVTGRVSGNTVRIERDSSVTGSVYGGYTENGTAEGNFVYVDGTVRGGVEGGHTLSGDASGNTVVMEGGTVFDRLYGGYTGDGSASSNSITVTAGRVRAAVAGGYDDGTAVNNTVTLYDTASFAGSDLYGGRSDGTSSDVFTGNTLNLHGQIQADSLQNFQNLNFSDVADGTPGADLAKSAVLGDGKGSFTNVAIQNLRNQHGNVPDEYVLIHTPKASSSFAGTNLYVNGADAVTIGSDGSYVPYTGTVSNDGTLDNETGMTRSQSGFTKDFLNFDVDYFIKNGQDLVARTKNVQADHRTKSFNIDRLPGLALLDQGGDLAAGAGMESAAESAMCLPGEEPCGTRAFMAVSGGYSTYKADTHFNMTSGNAMVGLARYCKLPSVGFLAGVFFETGLSRFDAEHEYAGYDSFDSEGNASYYGAGALGKLYLNETAMQGLYAEGSFRIGMLNYSWDTDGWRVNGSDVDYSSESPYMAAHGGIGWMKSLTDSVDLDIYAKYLWSHVSGDDDSISGSHVNFDAMDSNRLRGGARLSFKGSDTFSWYLGAAYERQFNGRSASDVYGYDTPSASLKGDTAMVEAGLQLKPSKDVPVTFMLGASGYAGTREGVSGTFQIRYEF